MGVWNAQDETSTFSALLFGANSSQAMKRDCAVQAKRPTWPGLRASSGLYFPRFQPISASRTLAATFHDTPYHQRPHRLGKPVRSH
jgi:hypothetical protein